jgi:alpha-1,2-glucosyltransferase
MIAPAIAAVHFNTIIHPFTLADNRHYVFYVFKIIRKSELIKYMALPGYLASGWLALNALHAGLVSSALRKSARISDRVKFYRVGFSIVWIATSALSLITAPLVEPRYFIIPWVIWRLQVGSNLSQTQKTSKPNTGKDSKTQNQRGSLKPLISANFWLWLETIWFIVVNVVTGYIFLRKTFDWPQEPGLKQRFMW